MHALPRQAGSSGRPLGGQRSRFRRHRRKGRAGDGAGWRRRGPGCGGDGTGPGCGGDGTGPGCGGTGDGSGIGSGCGGTGEGPGIGPGCGGTGEGSGIGPGCGGTGEGSGTDSIVFIADPFRLRSIPSVCALSVPKLSFPGEPALTAPL